MLSDLPTVWSIEPHTQAKHEILRNYLKAWFPILSRWSGRILYLDGFAGPGIYLGNEPGSPIIAIETAVEHSLRQRFGELFFLFIEKDPDRAAKLKEVLTNHFPNLPKNIGYQVVGAEFAPTLEQVLQSLEQREAKLAPTFAFLDPFGFSGFPMKLIGRMMSYEKCEVLITFMEGFVNRFTDEMREPALNELYATVEWKKIREIVDPSQRQRFLLDLYERQLRNVGGAKYVRSFGMINRYSQPLYYLVFGTKHWKGLEVMKYAMFKVDRTGAYKFSDLTDPNQTYLVDYGTEQAWVPTAANAVYNKFRGKTVSKSDVYQFVVTETPYMYRKSILEYLEKMRPSKISNVSTRQKRFSYPEGCSITFS